MDASAKCVGCGLVFTWLDDSGLCYRCQSAAGGTRVKTVGNQHYEYCRVCSTSLRGRREDAQFCSDGCRQKFHRAINAGHDKWCANCHKSFKAKRRDAETCSSKCRQALYRARKEHYEPVQIGYEIPVVEVWSCSECGCERMRWQGHLQVCAECGFHDGE